MKAEKLVETLEHAVPLERLRFLQMIKDDAPRLRAEAVAELEAAGWSRYRIADVVGISRQAVYQWET